MTHVDPPPFGVPELLAAVAGAQRVLDAGCGSGRLTVALASAGAEVTGIDTSTERLEDARRRAADTGVELRLVEADFEQPLPFADRAYDAVTSRLSLMIPADPVSTLTELRRVLEPEGRIATVLWASLDLNPWFAAPREAAAAALGPERAAFARAFGRLGDPEDAAAAHRAAGFVDVEARLLREQVATPSARAHWESLARDNGHYRRLDASLTADERVAVTAALEERLSAHRDGDGLSLPRTLVLVGARRPPEA